jgi:hypothetical protein
LPSNNRGIFTELLPSNDKGIFTEPLPSNDRGGTHTHSQQHELISLLYFIKIRKVDVKQGRGTKYPVSDQTVTNEST